MQKTFLLLSTACFSFFISNAQITDDDTLLTIASTPVSANEFVRVYNKNLNLVQDDSQKEIDSYLELFINYKLKLTEAKALRYDKDPVYLKEFQSYKNQLTQSYLTDKNVTDDLVREAYDRTTNEVKAQHILILLDEVETDTLAVYSKVEAYRERLVNEDFESLKKELHNGKNIFVEDLGYFSAFKMVYNFESAAYETEVGAVSQPFRTRFGFHVIKVLEKRKSRGQVTVAHIMIANTQKDSSLVAKDRIQELYRLILQGEEFGELAKQFSDDKSSSMRAGELKPFKSGQINSEIFETTAFELSPSNPISKPIQTQFGWHIVKLLKKYPIESFDNLKSKIAEQVEQDERSNLVGATVIKRLLNEYKITVNEAALKQFEKDNWNENPEKFKSILLTIEQSKIPQSTFIYYLKSTRPSSINNSFIEFKEKQILNYYSQNIEKLNPEFATMFSEFKEGLLLFDLLESKVWEKSKDSVGLSNYFNENKSEKYSNKELKDTKGKVISDFQNYLEQQWIRDLHIKYKVEFNSLEKDRILKTKI